MTNLRLFLCACILSAGCDTVELNSRDGASDRPNVLLIVADDLGMAELGAFGGEIPTPNLNALATQGVRLSAFHAAPVCSTSRAMLLTGSHSHLAGLGNMAEEMAPNQKDQPGYEGHLNDRVVTVATLLRDDGYRTYYSGKWHLGTTPETGPRARGFERAFSLLSGGAHHFSDMRPAYAPSPEIKAPFMEDGKRLQKLPENYSYSSQFLVDKLIEYLSGDRPSERDEEAPFFAMLSFMAPHWPLQAPEDSVRQYRGKYDQGYEVVARERLARQVALGIVPPGSDLASMPPKGAPWEALSDRERRVQARAMEIYAAMVSDMDYHTGRLIEHLKSTGAFDNTVVIFISDNGAEGHDLDQTWPAELFPDIRATIDATHDFSYENMGKLNSYTMYGPGWAWAAAPALRGHKGFVFEGGIRVPAFFYDPQRFAQGQVQTGNFHILDVTPTILEIAGVQHPGQQHSGRELAPVAGKTMMPYLQSASSRPEGDVEIGEVLGKRYVLRYPWKIVHQPPPDGNGQWQLFNLQDDLAESRDLAARHPELIRDLKALWLAYAEQNRVILPDWVSGY